MIHNTYLLCKLFHNEEFLMNLEIFFYIYMGHKTILLLIFMNEEMPQKQKYYVYYTV